MIDLPKLLVLGINFAVIVAVLIIQTTRGGYHSSVFATYPIALWAVVICMLIAVIGVALTSSERATICTTGVVTLILIFVAAKAGAGVYGPDSYIKAMDIRSILQTGQVEHDLYNGFEVLSGISVIHAPPNSI
ncbi:hypothetical protein [Halovalidus salilacus]|uniref:hypothetical protein n=1 Tax=Halovalidus salilacus TaxID=3075124 RepID=UPI00387DD5BB